uniref:Selenoprotein W n=1 Tax=Schistocephalus solidus TaxID=70667 RepID=A0A0V0J4V7_SCHSO
MDLEGTSAGTKPQNSLECLSNALEDFGIFCIAINETITILFGMDQGSANDLHLKPTGLGRSSLASHFDARTEFGEELLLKHFKFRLVTSCATIGDVNLNTHSSQLSDPRALSKKDLVL